MQYTLAMLGPVESIEFLLKPRPMEVKEGVMQGNPDPFWAKHYLAVVEPLKTAYVIERDAEAFVNEVFASAKKIAEHVQWGLKPDRQMFFHLDNKICSIESALLDKKCYTGIEEAFSLLQDKTKSKYIDSKPKYANAEHLGALIQAYETILGLNMARRKPISK